MKNDNCLSMLPPKNQSRSVMKDRRHSIFSHYRHLVAIATACTLAAGCSATNISSQHLPHYLSGMSSTTIAPSKRPQVVVTNSVLCDLTQQIAGETIDLVCLLAPGSDPHTYQLTAAARRTIARSQLVMYGGYGLESNLIQSLDRTPKVAIHELAVPRSQTLSIDGKNAIDPHVWHDARHTAAIVNTIGTQLQQHFPARASLYQQNTQKLTAELTQLDRWIRSQISTIPESHKMVFTTHDALGYYARAYHIPVAALTGTSTAERPNAATTQQLIAQIEQKRVPTIYVELTSDPNLMRSVAGATQVKLATQEIYADGLGDLNSSGGTYQQMMISNTKEIVMGLGGKYTPFELRQEKLAAK